MKKTVIRLIAGLLLINSLVTPTQCKTRSDYAKVDGTILYTTSSISQDNLNKEIAIYNRLDPGIRQALMNVGIRYYLINEANDNTTTGHTGDTMFDGNGGGIWDANTKLNTIYSEGRLGKDLKYNGTVMNHELGHVVDTLYGGGHVFERCLANNGEPFGASATAEWRSLYKQYKSTIASLGGLSKYEVYSASEAFAESYGHYAKNPAAVRKSMPEVAAFIDKVNADVIARYAPEYKKANSPELAALSNYPANGCTFNALTYYNRYPDLQKAIGANPDALYRHYIQYGKKEGRIAI